MRYVEVLGTSLSSIGLGTWQFGSKEWGYGAEYALITSQDILRRAIELGVNFIDTAEFYGNGSSESIIGESLTGEDEGVFIATKFFPAVPLPSVLISHAYRSAQRLKREVIDLYQLHFPNPAAPLATQVKGLGVLLDRGVVRQVGVSNFSLFRWQQAEKELGGPIYSNQVHFSLLSTAPMNEMISWAAANDRLVIAYSPLEQGILSGKYMQGARPKGFRRWSRKFSSSRLNRAMPVLTLLGEIAERKDVKRSQVALAWLIGFPNVVVIPGASTVTQLEENVAAAEVELSSTERADLTEGALVASQR